jgi:putative membrane protein
MMWWGGDWSWGAWLIMSLMMLAFWALVIWALVLVARNSGTGRRDGAEDALADRFARGEIDENEYRRRREVIRTER